MKRLSCLVLIAASLARCAGRRTSPASPPVPQEGYLHGPSGRFFPDQAGLFLRGEITYYDERGFDTSVGYETMMIAPRIVLTAYVYPAPGMRRVGATAFAQHYAEVQAMVLRAHPDAEPVLEEATTLEDRGREFAGRRAVFRFTRNEPGDEHGYLSEVYLFARGPWFLKYRVTYAESSASSCAADLRGFFHGVSGGSGTPSTASP